MSDLEKLKVVKIVEKPVLKEQCDINVILGREDLGSRAIEASTPMPDFFLGLLTQAYEKAEASSIFPFQDIAHNFKQSSIYFECRSFIDEYTNNDQETRSFYRLVAALFEKFLRNFAELIKEKLKIVPPQKPHLRFLDFLLDMTPTDFHNWRGFIQRRLEEMDVDPNLLISRQFTLKDGLVASHPTKHTENGMEGYYQLDYDYTPVGKSKSIELPSVRYGTYEGSTKGVIYATQGNSIYAALKFKIDRLAKWKVLFKEAIDRGLIKKDKMSAEQILNAIEFYRPLVENGTFPRDDWGNLGMFCEDLEDEEEYLRRFQEAKTERKINQKITGALNKGIDNHQSTLALNGGHFVSFSLSIKRLHEIGVREVRVPLTLPVRVHSRKKVNIDKSIFLNQLNLCYRLAYEFEGVEMAEGNYEFDYEKLRNGESSGDDYVVLKLGDAIRPRREPVKEFFGEAFAA